jgi:hypothetical protein
MNEMKKLWNLKLLAIIAALGVLTWFAFLYSVLDGYNSMTTHGSYGKYQNEMFDLYGDTLSPEERADYDIPGKLAAVYEEADAIIAQNSIFAKYGVGNFAEYIELMQSMGVAIIGESAVLTGESEAASAVGDIDAFYSDDGDGIKMQLLLDGGENVTLDEWYDSPQMKYQSLYGLQSSYEDYQENLETYAQHDTRPFVARLAKELLEKNPPNEPSLVRYDLLESFSYYAAIVGVFAVLAALLLVAPTLTNDHARKITHLQYSSKTGRKIMRYKFAATLTSVTVMSVALIVAAYIPFIANDAYKYWNSNIMSFNTFTTAGSMYNVTFGQYAIILAALSVAFALTAACAAFVLARFSSNVVILMFKAIPVGAAVAAVCALSLTMCFAFGNIIFNEVFNGRYAMTEVWVSVILIIIGLAASAIVVFREKRVDVT